MKTKLVFLSIILLSILSLFLSCNEKSSVEDYSMQIKYLSHKSSGCISDLPFNTLAKVNSGAAVNWEYWRSNLKIKVLFNTLCDSQIKDSVVFIDNNIYIFLSDTNKSDALCSCPFREEFNFKLIANGDINVLCFFKQSFKPDYHLFIDTTFNL